MTISDTGSSLPPPLTPEQKAELEAWADANNHPRVMWQVFDETASTEDTYAEVKFGDAFTDRIQAERWILAHPNPPEAWTIYRMTRAVTRDREVWYMEGNSPVYTCW